MIRFLLFVTLFFVCSTSLGQVVSSQILFNGSSNENVKKADPIHPKRLYIGDKVPEDIVFENVINSPGGNMKLSDFKGKLIILDFWNKYCSTCIEAFPKMEELHRFLMMIFKFY